MHHLRRGIDLSGIEDVFAKDYRRGIAVWFSKASAKDRLPPLQVREHHEYEEAFLIINNFRIKSRL